MINFREIFNINNSYIGLIIIGVLIMLIFLLDKKRGIRIIGYSFLVSGIILLLIYLFGNMFVSSSSYSFLIEIITDNFFSSIFIFSIVSVVLGIIGIGVYKYI